MEGVGAEVVPGQALGQHGHLFDEFAEFGQGVGSDVVGCERAVDEERSVGGGEGAEPGEDVTQMPLRGEEVVRGRCDGEDPDGFVAQGVVGQGVDEQFQGAGERPAEHRRREDHRVRGAHAFDGVVTPECDHGVGGGFGDQSVDGPAGLSSPDVVLDAAESARASLPGASGSRRR